MLAEKELATILAALRFFQANFNDLAEMREEMPLQFENVVPLNHQEIDELCEQLNTEAYFIISHLSYFHRENTKAPASDSNRLTNEKMEQITDQTADTFLDFSDQKSEAVVDINATNLLQRKNLLVEINERNGEKEYTFRCLAQCSCDQNPMFVADAIALNWYEDCLDEDPYDRDSFWFESGAIAVEVAGVKELPAQHYDVLNLYLSDLTPVDTDIAMAIAYKSAALGYQGENENV